MMETQIQTLVKEREERQKAQAAAAVVQQQQQSHVVQQQQQTHVSQQQQQQQTHVVQAGSAPPQIFTETVSDTMDVTVNSKNSHFAIRAGFHHA